ncbi:unnamed protein product [Rotaria magnacalcarata]|uniref:Uncharacterized protein n=1 Tax=Rotaria magnacalcarata TaxID=392030 RepID=A0A816MVF0_9BILA|nr:unnamed protein product [Rotaria magnacalcarata]
MCTILKQVSAWCIEKIYQKEKCSFSKSIFISINHIYQSHPSQIRTMNANDSSANIVFSKTTAPYHPPLPVGNGITSISVEETSIPNPSVPDNTDPQANMHATQETTATT